MHIEHRADTLDDAEQRARIRKIDAHEKGVVLVKGHFKVSVDAVCRNRAVVDCVLDEFDSRSRPGSKEIEHRLPMVGRAEAEPETILLASAQSRLPRQPPDLRRRAVIHRLDPGVETAYAAKAGCYRHLVH